MRTILLSLILLLTAAGISAAYKEKDGIVYSLESDATASVVNPGKSSNYKDISYAGEMTIPATVEFDGITYQVTTIGSGCFQNNNEIVKVNMPEGLIVIKSAAFQLCSSITEIVIPNSVTDIEGSAFNMAMGLKTVTLGSGLKNIKYQAFNCKAIENMYCLATVPPTLANQAFKNIPATAVLHVPAESLAAYQEDGNWSKAFKTIQAMGGSDIVPVESITLSRTSITGIPNTTVTLTATVMPENATYKTVTWTSSDNNVATVSEEGVVLLVAAGTAQITAACGDISATCEVTVDSNVGIGCIEAEDVGTEYYSLQGIRINVPKNGQTVIVRKGGRSFKAVIVP